MYAAVMHLSFQAELAPAAASAFSTELLPRVRQSPGFVRGYWLDPVDGAGLGLLVFEDEAQAQQASLPDRWRAPGVTVDSVEIRRVAATAP